MKIQQHPLLIVCALLWACMLGSPRFAYAQMLGVTVEVDTVFGGQSDIDPTGLLEGYTSYLIYANFTNPTDVLGAVFSDTAYYEGTAPMAIDAPCGCWNPDEDKVVIGSFVNSIIVQNPAFSLYEYDTFWTIGKKFIDDPGVSPSWQAFPSINGANICSQVVTNGLAYIFSSTGNWPVNAIAGDDLRILIGRVTTCGPFTITMNAQVYIEGDQENTELFTMCEEADLDLDGICDTEDDCVGLYDACGICNGPGPIEGCGCDDIPEGDCDCQGNQLDAAGICGGDCTLDADADGICDDEDDCDGSVDECGVCNGPGAIYSCGCEEMIEGDCDCDGNQLDALGECGGPCDADIDSDGICDDVDDCAGAFDECGVCNGPGAIYTCGCEDIPAGECDCEGTQLDALGVCGGDCDADVDSDGICDDFDDCVGEFDVCGLCNGPGAIYSCGCEEMIEGDCDCDGNQLDALGECGGPCDADIDSDGICDDVDDCAGAFDECGVCNGPGAIYTCGCEDIPAGECDCEGTQLDALGVCGGDCDADVDSDGICDDVDDCVGEFDVCGICNGPGAIYECGCTEIIEGDCNCDGNQLDALGVCGGSCDADVDSDGICDDIDPCVGEFDECGVCNGLGAIYECGCADIPAGDCDCEGNQLDALGVCGGPCDADVDSDGICDDIDPCVGEFDECGVCNGFGAIYECGCADIPAGDCDCEGNQLDALEVCGGDCAADVDADGICDDVDDCVGEFDVCGICNGPGAIYECGCTEIIEGDCNCDGNQLDALGVCGGPCDADVDSDGICDDIDPCVGEFDECGVCNGLGAIYECGCADIPAGDCDCEGNQLDALEVCGGDCAADADADGICDDEDDCVGALDACGVCNGPGEIYECGCFDIPAGDCDCEGNQLDALEVCGGDCAADADADGICDDEDDCVGALDACGVCNGPGEIYECGCSDIPAGDCDCDGNQIDALGVCGGDCAADEDADGICDDLDPCVGELDACGVCNGPGEIYECGCADIPAGDCDCEGNQLDALGVCGGDCAADEDADGICDDVDPCVGELDACGVCNGPGEIYECGCEDIIEGDCDCGGNQLDALGECGGDCAVDSDADGICDDEDDCIGAFDACGVCNGPGAIYECGCSDIPEGDCDCDGNQLDALEVCGGDCAADADADGICDDEDDCVGVLDACGVCNGPGEIYECGCFDIPAGDCDCEGSQLDALEVCGGDCAADEDADGICDDVDPCVGELDACGVCNGPGEIYECGCFDIPAGDCDCEGNQLDALEVCGGDCAADADADGICDDEDDCLGALDACGVCNGPGEIYECGCFDIPEGDCDCDGNQLDALEVCGGDCAADADADGICDDEDDCVGALDACGVCNGPGEIYECGCADIPEGDCDCDGNQLDALEVCGGDCAADADADGICDDEDDCVGALDACGVCNGPGEIYECGCFDIPEGDCDCDGNQLDALEVCGGDCAADADADGICDDEDDCLGALDACGVCNGPGEIYECGCADIPEGDCDCEGNQLDALEVCGGDCAADVDADGICDDVDPCVGELDACGVCNGPGEIYECGCADIPEGDCDCDGNQLDALGFCGGDCVADADADGICDDEDDCVGAYDECGVCNGPGPVDACGCDDIPQGDCDCDGNQLDALDVCGGDCAADDDADGICDDEDDCVGALDACGVCNGPGEIYECGCFDIPAGDCDCDGNQIDALGVCGGDCAADEDADGICDDEDDCVGELDACGVCNGPGDIYECGCFDIPAGDCDCDGNQLDALEVCGGDCAADEDADGICDDEDDCVGALDACGVCNGPGEIYECGCSDIPAGDCDCDGNQIDALGVCGGDCAADEDADGICDDLDPCVGELDACGVCNGPGEIYECGCADIPAGDCDCEGNQLDALGVCGGDCAADEDADGICDDVDPCVGELDACGVCNGPGEIYECGCEDIIEGDCDCGGNQLDALGECGGDCAVDSDADGICDDEDDCIGAFDACGVCNGPGAIYECGCSDIPEGDCDCDGNQLDALGVCGGSCAADADMDGICDDVDDCVGELDACGVCNGSGVLEYQETEEVCGELLWNDTLLTTSGSFGMVFVMPEGCDSAVTLDLVVHEVYDEQEEFEACAPWMWNGMLLDSSGTYTYQGVTEFGCDSVTTLDFDLLESTGSIQLVTGCDSVEVDGVWLDETQSLDLYYPNAVGCDSLVVYDVELFESDYSFESVSSCTPVDWNGLLLESSGTYTLQSTNEFGCDSVAEVQFELTDSLFISIVSPEQVCEDEPFSAQVNGWSSGDEAVLLWVVDTLQFANVGAIELTPSQTGLQEIAVIAETQTCEESATITVEVLDNPAVSLLDVNQVDVDCFGASTGVIEVLMDASAPLDYMWSGDVSDSNVAFDLAAGEYEVVVGNQGVCADTLQFTIGQSLPLNLALIDSTFADCGLDNGEMVVSADGGVGPYAYSWEPGVWTPSGASQFTLSAGPNTVMVMDDLGCTVEATFDLGCDENVEVVPYEFISPNGNGANETWVIENGAQHEDLRISVYNRWGVEVFSHEGAYYNTWGGTARNGNVLPSATYFWVVESESGLFAPVHGFLEIQAP